MPVLKAGCTAYYDTFNGPIPCRVLSVSGTSHTAVSSVKVRFKLTETVKAYKKGEILECSSLWVFPRACLKIRQYQSVIAPYSVEKSEITKDA